MTLTRCTCLIPAYNEAARIGLVLNAVLGHPHIAEVLVIDDGSSDGTAEIAQNLGAKVIRLAGNSGKTGALCVGLAKVKTSHVLLIDADLLGLSASAITSLIAPVAAGHAEASISLRGNAPLIWRLLGLDYISGERVIPMTLLAGQIQELAALPRFGFEVFLNDLLIAAQTRISVVRWPDVQSPSKASKRGLIAGLGADAAMMRDIFWTVSPWHCLRQILTMRDLAEEALHHIPQRKVV